MRKIIPLMVSTILVATSLASAKVDDSSFSRDDLEDNLPKKELYLRKDSENLSLAQQAGQAIQPSEEEQGEHTEIGTRQMSHSEYVKHQELRAEKLSETEDLAADDSQNSFVKKDLSAKKLYYTSSSTAYHRAIGITFFGEQVTLEDGSVWGAASWDQWKTLDWLTSDTILVMQNKWIFSTYKFMLVNQNTGKEVECNLILGPIYAGAYTHWIVAIDYINCEVMLENGTLWQIDLFDYGIMRKWMLNDTVIIGFNQSGSVYHPNILINTNMLNYSCGMCIH